MKGEKQTEVILFVWTVCCKVKLLFYVYAARF